MGSRRRSSVSGTAARLGGPRRFGKLWLHRALGETMTSVPDAPIARPEITALLARGVSRMLIDLGYAPVLELPLGNGRRADVVGLAANGELWIVETKSCLADYAIDQKWPDYL